MKKNERNVNELKKAFKSILSLANVKSESSVRFFTHDAPFMELQKIGDFARVYFSINGDDMVELYCYDVNRIDYTFEYSIDSSFSDKTYDKLIQKVVNSLPIYLDRCSKY